ncbi:MAG TPA: GntR family transcriptional regulator [Leifsonia sp.]|jgi:GntR family transcriptional regulator|nr:GntR family transcriptional regulator [Leifsonia sp.]
MESALEDFLARPLDADRAVPLRVSVYTRIAEAIRTGVIPVSSLMPSESELGGAMSVSRTVVREAMMLLTEDGFVNSRRGIGRVVAGRVPRVGIERLKPIEQTISDDTDVLLQRHQHVLQPASPDFVAEGLGIEPHEPSWFIESILTRAGTPVALVQEHLPAGGRLEKRAPDIAARLHEDPAPTSSVLALLIASLGNALGPAQSILTVGTPGQTRGRLLDLTPDAPVLILTQTVELDGRPLYLAKVLVNTNLLQPTVMHTL